MAVWQMMTKNGLPMIDTFDDGLTAVPGDEGFTSELAEGEAGKRKAVSVNYVGQSPNPDVADPS